MPLIDAVGLSLIENLYTLVDRLKTLKATYSVVGLLVIVG